MTTRPVEQIQRAHDMIVAILIGDVPNPISDPQSKQHLHAAADALCWVLCHDHNKTFGENLRKLEALLKERGYQLNDHGN